MLNKFESNIRNSTLKYRAYKNSIFDLPQVVLDEKYDIIIISCVLTSLPHHPKFLNIVNLLKPKGTIIIADIHPCLTQKKPFYDFEIENNKIALAPRTVYPLDIIKELLPLNIEIVSVDLVENTEKEKYSFVLQFKKRI